MCFTQFAGSTLWFINNNTWTRAWELTRKQANSV